MKKTVICPNCKKELTALIYVKNDGYQTWNYPILRVKKNGAIHLSGDDADLIREEYFDCSFECPECEGMIDAGKIEIW